MREFILAALPWILTGIPIAVLCAAMHQKKRESIALGASLGLLLGVALNGCGLWESHALGFAIGPLWGMAIAALLPPKKEDRA